MAYMDDARHVFIGPNGDQVDLEMSQKYIVSKTVFVPWAATRNNYSSPQHVKNGTFYHYVAESLTINEDPV